MSDPETAGGAGGGQDEQPGDHLARRLLIFGRLLRRHGLAVGASQIAGLASALTHIDLSHQDDVYHAMAGFFVRSSEDRQVFDRLFELYWLRRLTFTLEAGGALASIAEQLPASAEPSTIRERLFSEPPAPDPGRDADPSVLDITPTYSPVELLRHKDFASYTEEERRIARQYLAALLWRLDDRLTRRRVRTAKRTAYPDLRRVIQKSIRRREFIELAWRRRQRKPRPLVIICDISGSMERYSRLFLHLMAALVQDTRTTQRLRPETFVFGTRLTRITPALRHSNLDVALTRTAHSVVDWSGGTRIGASLHTFNTTWARRVLGHGAIVLIISDGWDRGDTALLNTEIARLHRRCGRLIWLNPLAGDPAYQPLVRGVQTILPHVDEFLPLHNLASLEQVASLLAGPRNKLRQRPTIATARRMQSRR